MYCKYCGKDTPPNSKFCQSCGKKLNSSNHSSLDQDQDQDQQHNEVIKKSPIPQGELIKRRNKWIGWVLVTFSTLGIMSILLVLSEGSATNSDTLESAGNNPLPYIVDFYFGIQLIRQKEEKYLNWVYIRIIIGLVVWGLIAISSEEWSTAIIQAIYSAYFIYLIKTPLTEKSLKIANYVILPIIVISLFFI